MEASPSWKSPFATPNLGLPCFTSFRIDFLKDTCEKCYSRYNMDVKVGDIYIRRSDGKICRVKRIDHKKVVLESQDGTWLTLADIFGLEKAYSKKEPDPTQ